MIQTSPGYDVNAFYEGSSYLRDYVSAARELGVLFGESSLPSAVYVSGVNFSVSATQQVKGNTVQCLSQLLLR